MRFILVFISVGCTICLSSQLLAEEPLAPVASFEETIGPLIASRCIACHGPDAQEGGVRFDEIDPALAFRRRPLWKRAARRVALGEMPPSDDTMLPPEEREALAAWFRQAAETIVCDDPATRDPGPSPFRRLSAREYEASVKALLGVPFSAAEFGIADEVAEGAVLVSAGGVTSAEFEKYVAAAERVTGRLFSPEQQSARDRLFNGDSPEDAEGAERLLARLLRAAYRRPISAGEVSRYRGLYESKRAAGLAAEVALREALTPMLFSPHFLFRVEQDRPAPTGGPSAGVPISDQELAVRLSYFLWSAPPDEQLARLADAGELSQPATLDREVGRMLADRRARALTEGFAARWLQLEKLESARPTTQFFPAFNGSLKRAMREEMLTFFDDLRQRDLPITNWLAADYTFVNADLARHYGIEGISGGGMQRVTLADPGRRGGLLGMAGMLTLTSHTFRTSPTLRGKYVLDVLLGDPPPPPPPDAGTLEDAAGAGKQPLTFREQLAVHATAASCAGCHRKIDPLGFALDNYDPIGSWRESTRELPLDVAGQLPTGESIAGAASLKGVLWERREEFVRNFSSQLLVYALGRPLDWYDDCAVRELTEDVAGHEDRFSAVVRGIVKSVPFRTRRPASAE